MNKKEFINIFNNLKEINEITIPLFAAMKNGEFVDFEYFYIEKNNYYYYIENSINNLIHCGSTTTITAYKKIDWNTKKQCSFPHPVFEFADVLNFIKGTEKHNYNTIKGTFKQVLQHDFNLIQNHITLYKYILKNGGFREKTIFENVDKIEMVQNDFDYKIVKVIDKDKNYFEINLKAKDWGRLVVG